MDLNGACGGNGGLVEVEPDVLLYFYEDGFYAPPPLRVQRFRVTATAAYPLPDL
jgi:hypothetical protein